MINKKKIELLKPKWKKDCLICETKRVNEEASMNLVVETPEEKTIEKIIALAKAENTRITASTNVELNQKIFSVYESALKPLKRLEEIQGEMESEHKETETKETFTRATRLLLVCAVPLAGIISVLIGYICFFELINEGYPFSVILVLYLILLGIIWIIPLLLLVLSKFFKKRYLKNYEKQLENDEKRQEEIGDIINRYGRFLALIPEQYRYYSAVSYMVKSYKAGKADCVKEAIVRYEENVYREFGVTDIYMFAGNLDVDMYQIDNL